MRSWRGQSAPLRRQSSQSKNDEQRSSPEWWVGETGRGSVTGCGSVARQPARSVAQATRLSAPLVISRPLWTQPVLALSDSTGAFFSVFAGSAAGFRFRRRFHFWCRFRFWARIWFWCRFWFRSFHFFRLWFLFRFLCSLDRKLAGHQASVDQPDVAESNRVFVVL